METTNTPSYYRRVLNAAPTLLICVIAACLLAYLFSIKTDVHIDECLSLSIANNADGTYIPQYDQNVFYADASEPYLQKMAVRKGHEFDFARTMQNDCQDTLPPLYYLLLHAVYSLSPGTFSIWFAAVLNIVIFVACALLLGKLARVLHMRRATAIGARALFATLPGTLEMGLFVRMYVLAMLWAISLAIGCTYLLDRKERTRTGAVWIGLSLVGGALTHYYFLIFAFFICLVTGILLLAGKRWKRAFCLAGVAVAAAILAVIAFPAMINQLFFGQLNGAGMENLHSRSLATSILAFVAILNVRLAGGLLPAFGIVAIATACSLVKTRILDSEKRTMLHDAWQPWIAIVVSAACYFLFVAKSSFYLDTRYMSPIYPLLIVVAVKVLELFARHFFGERPLVGILVLVCSLTTCLCFITFPIGSWEYDGSAGKGMIDTLDGGYRDAPVVVLYDGATVQRASATWMLNQDSAGVVFTQPNNLYGLANALPPNTTRMVVELDVQLDAPTYLAQLQGMFGNCNKVEKLGPYPSYYDVYALSYDPGIGA